MSRPAWAEVDLTALQANARYAKALHPGRLLAVVKADAYGHGVLPVCRALAPWVDGFAVAFLEEARVLRAAGIKAPILLLEGFFDREELLEIAAAGLQPVIHQYEQLDLLLGTELPQPLCVWLKLDTGMHRLGFAPEDYAGVWQRLNTAPQVAAVVKMSHFARADELGAPAATEAQLACFDRTTSDLPGAASLANSPALLAWPEACRDYNRAGLMLYGVPPFDLPRETCAPLQPVMRFCSRITAIRTLPAGVAVGYGARFVTPRPMRIGVVAVGYADGYPRHAADGTPVLVNGQRTALVGRISMDMLTVDLTDLPEIAVGAEVELWGPNLSVAEVARAADTIPYELLSHLKRVPVRYLTTAD